MSSPPLPSPVEGCGDSEGDVLEVRLNSAALSDPDALHIPLTFPLLSNIYDSGLVDSGSTHCFVDPKFVIKNSIACSEISPIALRLLDGSVGAAITQAADILVHFSTGDEATVRFFVTKLDSSAAFVFGYNWLRHYNP